MLTIGDSEGNSSVLFLKLFSNKKLKTKINANITWKVKKEVATEGCENMERGAVSCGSKGELPIGEHLRCS